MGRKVLGILIIIIGLATIIGLIWFVFLNNSPEDINQDEVVAPNNTVTNVTPPSIINSTTPTPPVASTYKIDTSLRETGVEDLKMIAAAFAERFGSYSNHSNYSNIVDLKLFMSSAMQDWADNFLNEMRTKSGDSDIYYGVTTKSISQTSNKFDNNLGIAEILVRTQRRESTGAMNNSTTIYQDILISFIKERGAWKVNEAYWH